VKRAGHAQVTNTLYDLVIIGGGITGVATARDAALRGLSVLLVEREDFAFGTSSRSSKLIHGGLRYLETYQFKLVAESLREREKAIAIAPHLTDPQQFLYLLYQGYPESKALLNLGLTFYDLAAGSIIKRRHSMLSAEKVLAREPHLRSEGLRGAGMYWDVLTDDARLTLDVAKGAAEAGADLLNHAAVTGLLIEDGHTRGVTITDTLSGANYDVHARQVVNATGPWTDQTRSLEHTKSTHKLRPTKGVHIVVKKSDFPLNTAVFLRSPDDNRVVWPTPSLQKDVVYIGTTDTDYTGDIDDVYPDERDITYLLNVANHTIPEARLTEQHVIGSWAGLRPLVAPEPGVSESNTSREHVITEGVTGMLTISGGKLTSNRLMAKQLVDAAVHGLKSKTRKAATGAVPVSGADMVIARRTARDARDAGVPAEIADTWIQRYGSNSAKILAIWKADPSNAEIVGARDLTRAEIIYSVEEEMVQTLADLLIRRTSAFFWDETGGLSHANAVADELERLVPWEPGRRKQEIDDYYELVQKHRPHPINI
jgi:glycerol-3-phosphate dehydrogenase